MEQKISLKNIAKITSSLPLEVPHTLSFQGNPLILQKPTVGIIGSRKPTFYGRQEAYRFAKALSQAGVTILSGGAIGIDAIATATALEFGASAAILGSGLLAPYPPSNTQLFKRLAHSEKGALLSEFEDFAPARKYHFPKRNQTLAILCDFLLIVEATTTSGSLITANAALDFGIDIGALPGPLDSPNSEGTNLLIKNGAFCIQRPEDILEYLQFKGRL